MPWSPFTLTALFGEPDHMTMDGTSSVISTVINGFFAGFVAWYLLTKSLPKMQEKYLNSIEKISKEFTETLTKQQQKHDEIMKLELVTMERQIQQNVLILEEIRDALVEMGFKRRGRRTNPSAQQPQSPPGPHGLTGGTKT